MNSVKQTVKAFVLEQFLPGEDPASLGDETPLITGGILDSISTLKIVEFLEKHYSVRFEPEEVGIDNLDTLDAIAATLQAKLKNL